MKKCTKIIIAAVAGVTAAALVFSTVALTLKFNDLKHEFEKQTSVDSAKISALESDNASLGEKLASAQDKVVELESSLADIEGYYSKYYSDKIAENESKIKELDESRRKLEDMLERAKNITGVDLTELSATITSLEDYIAKESPLVRVMLSEDEISQLKEDNKDSESTIPDHKWVKTEPYYEEGKKALGEAYNSKLTLSEVLAPTEAKAPDIAVYYEDLSTGYKYTYNGDKVFDSASVMKAPYITAVFEAYASYEAGKLEPDEDDERYSAENLEKMFALDEKIVLDHATMDKPGSGVLKDAEDGTEYTYKELMELSLQKSDNIAFALIRERFTNKWYLDFARENGAASPLKYYMNMTVSEAGEMFKSIYYFTLEDTEYGAFVRESMTDSAHSVLSKTALSKSDVAHKYGWDIDAYHDAAIVYGDRPYIAIVFTNIDSGGTDADKYIREIFKKIESIHKILA